MSIQSPTEKSQIAMQAKTQAIPPRELGDDLPSGGTVGQVLTKTATGSEWADVPEELPEGGSNGQFLKKTADGPAWGSIPEELPDYSQETAGKVLTVVEGATAEDPNEVSWETPEDPLPAGGTAGQVLTKTASGTEWADAGGGDIPKFAVSFTTSEYLIDDGGETQPVSDFTSVDLTLSGTWPSEIHDLPGRSIFALEVTIRDGNSKEFTGIMIGRSDGTGTTGDHTKFQMRFTGDLIGAYQANSQWTWADPNGYIIQNAILYINRKLTPFKYRYWGKVTELQTIT